MIITWQDIYYIVATISMVVVMIAFIWILRILYSLSKLVSGFVHTTQKLGNGIAGINNLRKNVTLGVLQRIIKFLDKGNAYDK